MKKLLFLLFIFSISYSVPSYASKVQNYPSGYVTCATDANGAIYVNDEAGGDVSSFAYASDYALDTSSTSFNLTFRGNVNDVEVDIGAHCDITPDNYKIKIYKSGFCSENPYQEPEDSASNTISADLSSCVFLFDNNDGKEVNIQPDKEIDLLEGDMVLPIGTYPFIYTIMDNIVNIKHTQKFVAAPGTATPVIHGYNPDPNDMEDAARRGDTCLTDKNDSGNEIIDTN